MFGIVVGGVGQLRVLITSEASVVPALVEDLEQQPGIDVQSIAEESDDSEQLFGLAEAASIIAIVRSAVDLAKAIRGLIARRPERLQSLRLKTAFGSVTVELSPDATIEELQRKVEPLFKLA